MDPVLNEASQKIHATLDHLKFELSSIRAGRANPSSIENVSVKAYGGMMKLLEVGTINAPQPSLLTVTLWDAGIVNDVVKSLQEANLGLNPSFEGTTIRLPIPPLTAERREELIKMVHQKQEETKISIRQVRQEMRDLWMKAQHGGEISEDEFERRSRILQDLVDKAVAQVDEMGKIKETELTQI
jgi:ribosome recycling factor